MNIQIRNRVRGDKRGRVVESYSYGELEDMRDNQSKSKNKPQYRRQGRGGR